MYKNIFTSSHPYWIFQNQSHTLRLVVKSWDHPWPSSNHPTNSFPFSPPEKYVFFQPLETFPSPPKKKNILPPGHGCLDQNHRNCSNSSVASEASRFCSWRGFVLSVWRLAPVGFEDPKCQGSLVCLKNWLKSSPKMNNKQKTTWK